MVQGGGAPTPGSSATPSGTDVAVRGTRVHDGSTGTPGANASAAWADGATPPTASPPTGMARAARATNLARMPLHRSQGLDMPTPLVLACGQDQGLHQSLG